MGTNLFEGRLVRLTAEDPTTLAEAVCRWERNSAYTRLLDSDPARRFSSKKIKEWLERNLDKDAEGPAFGVRAVTANRLIGFIGTWGLRWQHGDTYFAVGIGEAGFRGKGYGTETLELFLGYAFRELNLRRVSLNVFSYNPRAIRCYERCGFRVEGKVREGVLKDGKRWDVLYMGILREEWEQRRPAGASRSARS